MNDDGLICVVPRRPGEPVLVPAADVGEQILALQRRIAQLEARLAGYAQRDVRIRAIVTELQQRIAQLDRRQA